VVTALQGRGLTSATKLGKKEARELASELGITLSQLHDAMSQLPEDYAGRIGAEPVAAPARVVSGKVYDTIEGHPALDALFDSSPSTREGALDLLQQGATFAQRIAKFSGEQGDETPIDPAMLMKLAVVRDAVIQHMDSVAGGGSTEVTKAQAKSLGGEARAVWDRYAQMRVGDDGLDGVRGPGPDKDPQGRAIEMVLTALLLATKANELVAVEDLLKAPAVRQRLVSMLGELFLDPKRVADFHAAERKLGWFHEQVQELNIAGLKFVAADPETYRSKYMWLDHMLHMNEQNR
jgi:hypothetical protein